MKYYDFSKAWALDFDYAFICGGRSNGKTHATAEQWVANYLQDGSQFVRVVRYLFDMQSSFVENYFDDVILKELHDVYHKEIWYEAGCYMIKDLDATKKEADVLGYVLALSCEQKYKSNQYERVTVIDCEEFALADPTGYINSEADKFKSLMSTIVRKRTNVRCVFVGNTISKFNPYFTMLNVNLNKLRIKAGEIKYVPQPDLGYDEKPIVIFEFAQMAYESMKEIPRLLKIGNNDTATSGDYIIPDDVITDKDVNFDKRVRFYIVQIGIEKVRLNVFPCFCYWQHIKGADKTLAPDMIVRTMCYDKRRYFWNVIEDLESEKKIPHEMYYDSEDTKQFLYDNIIKNWRQVR